MKTRIALAVAPLAAVMLISACGSDNGGGQAASGYGGTNASATTSSARAAARVGLRTTKLGRILVDARGRTLYLFEKDRHARSSCSGACARDWPPLLTKGKPRAGKGVSAAKLKTTRRSNGKLQVVYNGHPLYRFAADTKAGQTGGQGLDAYGAEWYVMNRAGHKVEKGESSGGYRGYSG
jgi:predicted lipoprotein with Yx(FWY)xxD motif